MSLAADWQTELAPDTAAHLSDLLGFGAAIPSSARPMRITATPPAPKPPTSAERLATANQGKTGLIPVNVDERLYPLWIRAGTGDAAAATASLASPLKIPFQPRRILEIGAGSGYRSVALAQAYPARPKSSPPSPTPPASAPHCSTRCPTATSPPPSPSSARIMPATPSPAAPARPATQPWPATIPAR